MEQKVLSNNKEVQGKYLRQELILGSFILHSHPDNNSQNCSKQCKYIFMNQQKESDNNDSNLSHQTQIYEQSKNKGHPETLIKGILRENMNMFEFLIEIYSTYLHLQIPHKIFAELVIQTKFQSTQEQYQFIDSYEGNCIVIIFVDLESHYQFSIFNLKDYPKSQEIDKIFVKKANKSCPLLNQKDKLVSQNEWIVLFEWILFNSKLAEPNQSIQLDPIIARMRQNSSTLQNKINQIRKKSYTRLYDFSHLFGRQ